MAAAHELKPAVELVKLNGVHFPNESVEYRRARDALLAEEIELRRHIERVAEQRRALPPGGEIAKDYRFEGENGPVAMSELFGDNKRSPPTARLRAEAKGAVPDVHVAAFRVGWRSARR